MRKLMLIVLGIILMSGKPVTTNKISGVVKDNSTNEILAGVKIVNLTTDESVYTDFDGKFELVVSDTDSLEITYISYKTIIITKEKSSWTREKLNCSLIDW